MSESNYKRNIFFELILYINADINKIPHGILSMSAWKTLERVQIKRRK